MKSGSARSPVGSSGLANGFKRPGWLPALLAAVGCLPAYGQPLPASVTKHAVLTAGPSVVDRAGNVYGTTSILPPVMTTAGAAQTQPGGGTCYLISPPGAFPAPCYNAYIAKTDPSGNTVFATYLGGASNSGGQAIALDATGNVYVAGLSGSSFPTTANAAIPAASVTAAFAAKLSADGTRFLYATFLPAGMASVSSIAVDAQGNAYIAGTTSSEYIPAEGVAMHAAVVKVNADGSAIVYAKILGGSGQDSAASVVADASGDAFVAGLTSSSDFPVTAGALQPQLAGLQNAFLTELDPSGNVSFSTYLGGSGKDSAAAVQADAAGNIYLAGTTTSLDFPTTGGTVQPDPLVPLWDTKPGGFIAKFAPDGGSLRYATYFAAPVALSLGAGGDLYVAGGAGPGGPFSVTSSAPLPCIPGGPEQAAADLVAHLDANGALLDATYVNFDITAPMGFAWTGGNSVVMAAGGQAAQIVFGGPGWTPAPCMTLSALNAATLDPTPVVPGEFLTFLGFGIGPEIGVGGAGGVQVLFDGKSAPVLYAQSGQVNVQAPFELSGQTSTAITLTYAGATFGPVTVPLRFAYPGLFRLRPGVTAQAAVRNQDGSVNGPANPAAAGSVVTFWGTGFPATSPACATGGRNADGPVNLAAGFTVQMQGGPVLYAGGAPTLPCGVVQIDMQVPTGILSGPRLVTPGVCTNGGNTCSGPQTGSTIYIK